MRNKSLKPLIFTLLLSSIAAGAPLTVQADPLGSLVNMIMNKILDDRAREEEQARNHSTPAPNRTIPGETKTGTLSPPVGNMIKIDGDEYQLAFNSRIRDERNRIIHTTMIQQQKRVRYTLNAQNQVDKIWFLASSEQ